MFFDAGPAHLTDGLLRRCNVIVLRSAACMLPVSKAHRVSPSRTDHRVVFLFAEESLGQCTNHA